MTNQARATPLNWNVPSQQFEGRAPNQGDVAMSIAIAIRNEAQRLVRVCTPDLEQSFPFSHNFHFNAHFEENGWFGLRLIFIPGLSMMVGPSMDATDAALLKACVEPYKFRPPAEIRKALGKSWYDQDRFTYVGPIEGANVSWSDICAQLLSWLNEDALPNVLSLNAIRVQRAVPKPPSYDIGFLSQALWVLECEHSCTQGTAFALSGVGLVTCNHVLGSQTVAFRYDNPSKKYPIKLLAHNKVVDLAIIGIDAELPGALEQGDPSLVQQMDHILVLGHPNYRIGDSPISTSGLVAGFRPISGIRRLLTNAAIVAGCSGGPVFDRDQRVIGVAVTGADNFAQVRETEDIAIIPVDALKLFAP